MIVVREANHEDLEALWDWYKDLLHRRMIPLKEALNIQEYKSWVRDTQNSDSILLYTGFYSFERIGFVLFERLTPHEWYINLTLEVAMLGKNYSVRLLEEAISVFSKCRKVDKFVTQTERINKFSGDVFKKAGFKIVEREEIGLKIELAL